MNPETRFWKSVNANFTESYDRSPIFRYVALSQCPTLDIDFLGTHISNDGERIAEAFREICAVECEEDGVRFAADKIAAQNITEFKDYHGIRLSIPATMDTIAQVLTMDIGFGDVVTPHPVSLDYPLLLEEPVSYTHLTLPTKLEV